MHDSTLMNIPLLFTQTEATFCTLFILLMKLIKIFISVL